MTPKRHGQSERKVTDQDEQGIETTDRLELAVSKLLADLAHREPDLCRHLQDRLSGRNAHPPRGPDASRPIERPILVGEGVAMRRVARSIRRLATTIGPVMITGASGTGKELAARAIHAQSPRAAGPFAVIECAGVPPAVLAADLFGHQMGAIGGSVRHRVGQIETARGGTVVLNDIDALPKSIQTRLVGLLRTGTIQRPGRYRPVPVDVRIMAATSADVARDVASGRLRRDLAADLAALHLEMPRLSDCGDDIALIGSFYFHRLATELGCRAWRLSETALAVMTAHAWPGNVSELVSRMRRAVVMAEGAEITAADLGLNAEPLDASDAGGWPPREGPSVELRVATRDGRAVTLDQAKHRVEEVFVRAALERNGFNISAAASELGVSRVTLYRHMDRFGLRSGDAVAVR